MLLQMPPPQAARRTGADVRVSLHGTIAWSVLRSHFRNRTPSPALRNTVR
jgi:hypothetical protein